MSGNATNATPPISSLNSSDSDAEWEEAFARSAKRVKTNTASVDVPMSSQKAANSEEQAPVLSDEKRRVPPELIPPEPPHAANPLTQQKIKAFLAATVRTQKNFNSVLTSRTDFNNPAILEQLSSLYGISTYDTNLQYHVYESRLPKEDFIGALKEQQNEERARRLEKRSSVAFTEGPELKTK